MQQLNMYENYLKKCELSEQTCEVYLREAEHFLKYLNGRNVTKELALSYKKNWSVKALHLFQPIKPLCDSCQ